MGSAEWSHGLQLSMYQSDQNAPPRAQFWIVERGFHGILLGDSSCGFSKWFILKGPIYTHALMQRQIYGSRKIFLWIQLCACGEFLFATWWVHGARRVYIAVVTRQHKASLFWSPYSAVASLDWSKASNLPEFQSSTFSWGGNAL